MDTKYHCHNCGWSGTDTFDNLDGTRFCPECFKFVNLVAPSSLFASAARACNDVTPDGRYSRSPFRGYLSMEQSEANVAAREGLSETVDALHTQNAAALGFEYGDPADVADMLEQAEEDDERARDHRAEEDFARRGW